jgi:endonuclease VIII
MCLPYLREGIEDELRLHAQAEALAIVGACRPRMQQSALDGNQTRFKRIYGAAGQPCPRCGPASRIRERGQWDDNRPTFWCESCQT